MALVYSIPRAVGGVETFTSYWFRTGGFQSIAICRVALFIAVFCAYSSGGSDIVNASSVADYYASVAEALYNPKGIVRLLFPQVPPPEFVVELAILLGFWATLFAIIGLFTRASMIISVLSVLFILSLDESWRHYWSHGYNIIMLAGLAFMFGRAGDTWSVDALLRRQFGRPNPNHDCQYCWPVLLGQAAVALMYLGGFYAKWSGPDWTFNLDWILSDNLRHSLAMPWNHRGLEMPWHVAFITSNPILYKGIGAGHMINQLLPLFACFSINRPKLRLAEGAVFALGVVTLGLFMNLWNLPWLLMTAFFVDWDYFIRLARERAGLPLGARRAGLPPTMSSGKRAAIISFIVLFLSFYVVTIGLKLGSQHLMYPFSSMTFYSNVKALPPYAEHLHYPFYEGQISVVRAGEEVELYTGSELTGYFRVHQRGRTLSDRVSVMTAVGKALRDRETLVEWVPRRRLSAVGVIEYRLYTAVFHLPPYPAAPLRELAHRGLVGVYESGGTIRAAVGVFGKDFRGSYIDVSVHGFASPVISILSRANPRTTKDIVPLRPMLGRMEGARFRIEQKFTAPVFTIIRVSDGGQQYDFYGPEFVQ